MGQWCYWIGYCNTKLLQLDSSQNHFYKSNYDQSGDLNEFECTKFVHISTLGFLDSKMFYMFIGLHRLQICYFWITRAKDMNYLVLKCNLYHLNFASIIYTVTMWYYCLFGFYTFQGFQGYKICKIWNSGLFYIDFTRFSRNRNLKFKFKIDFDRGADWGWLGCDVARCYWRIPIRLRACNLCLTI
jgi:hypothetical protein